MDMQDVTAAPGSSALPGDPDDSAAALPKPTTASGTRNKRSRVRNTSGGFSAQGASGLPGAVGPLPRRTHMSASRLANTTTEMASLGSADPCYPRPAVSRVPRLLTCGARLRLEGAVVYNVPE